MTAKSMSNYQLVELRRLLKMYCEVYRPDDGTSESSDAWTTLMLVHSTIEYG